MKNTWINETPNMVGNIIEIFGWVDAVRDHGKVIFIDLRDKTGILQAVVIEKSDYFETAKNSRPESVLRIKGKLQNRPENLINPNLGTGKIELFVSEIEILSIADTVPIPLDKDGYEIDEALRLKYRYLDLRRKRLQKNLIQRNKVLFFIRNWLEKRGFVEVETPILTKSTPEGARDYLVPSRTDKGNFYALPQSPQQYKQLLMVSGIERYFQIAKCFRDEDPRGDRQPEFTQLDLEMSFFERDELLDLVENLFVDMIEKLYPNKKISEVPFPRLKYKDALDLYSSDKPDLRKNKDDKDELAFCFIVDFPMFEMQKTGMNAMHHPFTQPRMNADSRGFQRGLTQIDEKQKIVELLREKPLELLSDQYDLVLNGYEIGGGSIRITDKEILIEVFKALGHSEEDIKNKFGHLFEAFSYGVPPHGGIAPGIDRILMILENEPNIREVIAFPKTKEGRDPMMGSPSKVGKEQLEELGIEIKKAH